MFEGAPPRNQASGSSPANWLAGGGVMGALTRAKDWASTPVGPVSDWPQSLKMAVSICLGSRHPIVVWWGKEHLTQFYNDGYISFLGATKHPSALGQSARACWREIWHIIEPMLEGVFATGEATWSEDFLYVIDRNLPREEGYFTFSYSPIRDGTGAVAGIFCACSETTGRVIGERRLHSLRDLSRMEVQTNADRACEVVAQTLAENQADIPFSLIYLVDDNRRFARLVATTGLQPGSLASPPTVDLHDGDARTGWPLERVLRSGMSESLSGLLEMFGALPAGPWPESSEAALVAPIPASGQAPPTGVLVCGLSPRRAIDADYRSFVNLVAGHIGTSVANARAYAEERKRAEALAEIDRAKTLFFSNVSHEFRTPLTLMLGPLEEALAGFDLTAAERERLGVVHRNSLRLLKLVNSLLDFSRIEAGRAQASYEPTDLAALTTELASNFRSACERAGLKFVVDCPRLPEPIYVDRDMWEKIVLNLLSNAFKFTFEGEIVVRLCAVDGYAELSTRDTGVGVPQQELPRLFERFHRIEGQKGRTYEGSGIGLALVQELVKLHDGAIRVESQVGRGTIFTIEIPFGTAHLPQDRIGAERGFASTSIRADAYVQEALRWLPEAKPSVEIPYQGEPPGAIPSLRGAYVLLADDNADMRAYVRRLLGCNCEVQTVADGHAALDSIRARRPNLLLADVMMPRLDGFGLLRAIRADPDLRDLSVIMLSARAGEESRIEGLESGADDYLTKPFSARELIARVSVNLELDRVRREAVKALSESEEVHRRLASIVENCEDAIISVDLQGIISSWNTGAQRLFGYAAEEVVGKPIAVLIPPDRQREEPAILERLRRGERIEHYETVRRRKDGSLVDISLTVSPVKNAKGEMVGASKIARDITERNRARELQKLFVDEMKHRIKNTLSTVQAIAAQTMKSASAEERATFGTRLSALASAHDLLTLENWNRAPLREIVERALKPFQDQFRERVAVEGHTDVWLDPTKSSLLAMALHELATNAVKYGALSNADGRVRVVWDAAPDNRPDRVNLLWLETGGPLVVAPAKRGFGSVIIERALKSELGAVHLDFDSKGVSCVMEIASAPKLSSSAWV
jgi:PAS domain S-box-containing protein